MLFINQKVELPDYLKRLDNEIEDIELSLISVTVPCAWAREENTNKPQIKFLIVSINWFNQK